MGIAERFPRGGANSVKPVCGFARFPRARHLHSFVAELLLPLLRRAFEAVAILPGLDDVGLIGDAIDQSFAEASIGNHFGPLGKRQVGCQKDRCFLRSIGDDLEQILGSDFRHRHIADFVDPDHVITRPTLEGSSEGVLMLRFNEFIDQAGCCGEADPPLLPAGCYAQCS